MTSSLLLSGHRVDLRDFRSTDLDSVSALVADDRVTRWLSFDSRSRTQASEMLNGILDRAKATPRNEYYLAVDHDGLLVGFVRLGLSGVRACKLGYAINADYWGRGYATEACKLILNYAFQELGLHRVTAAIGPDNVSSIAVVKRLGLQYEGRLRDHVFTNGSWRDSLLFSILSDEW